MNLLADRRREEKERRRDEILDAAAAVAGQFGLDAITMDQVARQARLSRALLYVYFKDKNDLHLGLCERALELLLQRFVAETAKAPSGRDKLGAMGRAYIAFAQQFPVLFDALARFEASDGSAMPEGGNFSGCLAGGDRLHVVMTDAIKDGIADGSIRGDVGNADAVAIVLWGFMHGVIQLVASKGVLLAARGVTPELLFEQARELALHSLGPVR
jgi:TetR/AcrR family transcriptional regulator